MVVVLCGIGGKWMAVLGGGWWGGLEAAMSSRIVLCDGWVLAGVNLLR